MSRTVRNCLLLLSAVAVWWGHPARAGDKARIDYDIFERNRQIVVWMDLFPFLSPGEVEQLQDGIDIVFECALTLSAPRQFFGDRQVVQRTPALRVRYRPVTEDFLVTSSGMDWRPRDPFVSLQGLQRFLKDSVEIPLALKDSLDKDVHYTLEVKLTSISLTAFSSAAPVEKPDEHADSPVKYLFKRFLSLTGYGRKEYRAKSRPFSLDEIIEQP